LEVKNFNSEKGFWRPKGEIVITVTELAWAVSKILNYVFKNNRAVWVTNRGQVIAAITPVEQALSGQNKRLPGKANLGGNLG